MKGGKHVWKCWYMLVSNSVTWKFRLNFAARPPRNIPLLWKKIQPRGMDTLMTTKRLLMAWGFFALMAVALPCRAVELRVSREALQRTLRQQLFSGPDGRYYLKGGPKSACAVYAQEATLRFDKDRIVVRVKTHARLGKAVGGACLGITLSPTAEVALQPYGEGETIGFRDAQVLRVSDRRELNFLLSPFLRGDIPRSMEVNAADLLRKALAGSTATSGYAVTLDRLKVHSIQIDGDWLVVDVDGGLSVR